MKCLTRLMYCRGGSGVERCGAVWGRLRRPRNRLPLHTIFNLERQISMDDYTKANLAWWNEAAIIHSQSQGDIYKLASFKAGKTKLLPLELEEVGDVAGKRLLHLQCHFGLDTLSWARLGAKV